MQYSCILNIVHRKHLSVASVLFVVPLNIEFRRALTGRRWERWLHLLQKLIDFQLNDSNDLFHWNLVPSGIYTINFMYLHLLNGNIGWKMKVPLKIKICMWFVHGKEILTKYTFEN
jgi:hypothetical protein